MNKNKKEGEKWWVENKWSKDGCRSDDIDKNRNAVIDDDDEKEEQEVVDRPSCW